MTMVLDEPLGRFFICQACFHESTDISDPGEEKKMGKYHYFNDTSDPLIVGLDAELMAMLDMARAAADVPFTITSGKRSLSDNSVLKGAVPDSAHVSGLAVDLLVESDLTLGSMMIGLVKAGFKRFGLYYVASAIDPNDYIPRHLHVDIDPTKPSPCIWSKREQN